MILGLVGSMIQRVLDSLIKEHWQKKGMTLKGEGHPLSERIKKTNKYPTAQDSKSKPGLLRASAFGFRF